MRTLWEDRVGIFQILVGLQLIKKWVRMSDIHLLSGGKYYFLLKRKKDEPKQSQVSW